MNTDTPSRPVAAQAAMTTESGTTMVAGRPNPPVAATGRRSGEADPGSKRLGRRLTRMVAALATVAAVTLGGTLSGTASANAIEIQNGDQEWLYLGYEVDYYWDGYQWVQWYVTKWSPPAGAGRLHCWWQTADCWWEQHPWRQY